MLIQKISTAVILLISLFYLTPSYSATATVSWDPNSETDLSHYKIYYGQSSGIALTGFDNEIDVGNKTSFTITGLQELTDYYFVVTALDFSGNESGFSLEVEHRTDGTPPEDDPVPDPDPEVPADSTIVSLRQSYPNPSNGIFTIKFTLEESEMVSLKIYNMTGQLIKTLISQSIFSQGEHTYIWKGTDQEENLVSSGNYICRLELTNTSKSKQLIVLR